MSIKTNKGFSSIEILVAISIAVLCLTACVMVFFGGEKLIADSSSLTESAQIAQAMIQKTQFDAAADFDSVESVIFNPESGYKKSLEVKSIDFFTKQVTAKVALLSNLQQYTELTTIITDYNNTSINTCNKPLSIDLQNPQIMNFSFGLDLTNDTSGINPLSDIKAYKDKLFASISTGNIKTSPTFFVFALLGTATPTLVSSLDNAVSTTAGIAKFAIFKNYAYLASLRAISSLSDFGQLQIVDTSDYSSPKIITNFRIPGVTGTSGQGVGSSIAYQNGYVYIGLTKTGSGPEFNIIDVKDAQNPKLVGSLAIGNTVNAVLVKGDLAYLAHPTDSTSLPLEQLTVVDVSDPANPKRVGGFHAPDNQGNGKSLFIEGANLYLGRTVTTTVNPELYILGINNSVVSSKKISSSVNALLVNSGLIFYLTNTQLQIGPKILPLPGGAGTALTCTGGTVFAASASSSGFLTVIR